MSADEETVFNVVQSRRFACDRCHRQKLRCERSPSVAKGSVIISFGACSRCVKAGVSCHTTTQLTGSSSADTNNNTSNNISLNTTTTATTSTVANKRKTPPNEIQEEAATESSSASGSGSSAVSIPGPPFLHLTDIDEFDLGNISPTFDGTLFDTNTISFHDHSHFELGPDRFHGAAAAGSVAPSSGSLAPVPPNASPSPPRLRPLEIDGQRANSGLDNDKLAAFVEQTYFEGSEAHPGESNNNKSTPDPLHSQDTVVTVEQSDADLVSSPEDICRRRLLDLHSLLLSELHCITDADLAQAFFSDESASLPRGNANVSETNVVSRVLFASERLIDLLNGLCYLSASTSQPQAENSRLSCSCGATDVHAYHNNVSPTTSTSRRDTVIVPAEEDAYPSTSPPSMSSSLVELPMIICFLSCYISLLSVYRAIFTSIHDTLQSAVSDTGARAPTAASMPPLTQASYNIHPRQFHQQAGNNMEAPPAPKRRRPSFLVTGTREELPGRGDRGHAGAREPRHRGVFAQLDPPYITRQRTLGIRVQLEVMAHMLDQIEDAWMGSLSSEDAQRQPQPHPVYDAAAAGLCSPNHHNHHHQSHNQYHHVQQHLQDQDMNQSPLRGERSGLNLIGTPTMQLLQSMLAHEGYSSADGDHGMGLGSLMEIVESIRKLLRSTRFA